GEHVLAAQVVHLQVRVRGLAQAREGACEGEQLAELARGAARDELGVVAVLAPPRRVDADRLDAGVGARGDLHLRPRGRDRERADAAQRVLTAERLSIGAEVAEALFGVSDAAPGAWLVWHRVEVPVGAYIRSPPAPEPGGTASSRRSAISAGV